MRRDIDLSASKIMDLADQPKGDYLLYYTMPGNTLAALWVDSLEYADQSITAIHGGVWVTVFSNKLPWTMVHKDLVEVYTIAEYQDMERTNLADRVRMKKDFERVYGAAQGPETQQSKPWDLGDINER